MPNGTVFEKKISFYVLKTRFKFFTEIRRNTKENTFNWVKTNLQGQKSQYFDLSKAFCNSFCAVVIIY